MSGTEQTTALIQEPTQLDTDKEDKECQLLLGVNAKNYISSIHFEHVKHVKQRRFLQNYANTGAIGRSAQAADMSRQSHGQWMDTDYQGYRKLFALAQALYRDRLEAEATRRAVDGIKKPIYYRGKKVGTEKRYSDYLLGMALKANLPDKYADRSEVITTVVEAKDSFLSRKKILAEIAAELNKLQAKELEADEVDAIDVEAVISEQPAIEGNDDG